MADNGDNGIGKVIETVEGLIEAERVTLVGGDVLVIPKGKHVIDLRPFEDARLERPRLRQGQSEHLTLDSFVEHVARQRDGSSVIFATEAPPRFLAIYDYNDPTMLNVDPANPQPGAARFGKHRATYMMPTSPEWDTWQTIAGPNAKWLTQREFAEALEDRALDVLAPSDVPSRTKDEAERLGLTLGGPSTMLAVSRGLIVRADRKVGSAMNLDTGEARVIFEETHETQDRAGGAVVVPNGFAISIPVFRDGSAYALLARTRYRMEGSILKWRLALHRSDVAFRDAFYDVTKDVRSKTGLPLFYGTPE